MHISRTINQNLIHSGTEDLFEPVDIDGVKEIKKKIKDGHFHFSQL